MTEQEINDFLSKVDEGLHLAQKRMFKRKSLLGENVVVSDKDGNIVDIPAKQYLELHPEMQME